NGIHKATSSATELAAVRQARTLVRSPRERHRDHALQGFGHHDPDRSLQWGRIHNRHVLRGSRPHHRRRQGMKINIKSFARVAIGYARENTPLIMTATAVGGVVTTATLASKAGARIERLYDFSDAPEQQPA